MRVLHVALQLIPRSETFVQRRLSGLRSEPYVLGWKRIEDGLEAPCPSVVVPFGQEVDGLSDWSRWGSVASKVRRRIDQIRAMRAVAPDVVHAHFGWAATGIDRECRFLGVPLVATFYGKDISSDLKSARVRRSYVRMFSNVTALTAEGPALARRLLQAGAPADKVKLLPLALPQWALEKPERVVGAADPTFQLLQVSRFVGKKGLDITLRALAIALRTVPSIRLVLVGDGPLRADLETLAAELELGDRVEWAGFQPYSTLPEFLARAHAFIHPSRTSEDGDGEGGAPSTLIEAQSQGVPVIGTTHDDLPNVVRDQRTGLLSPENDPEAVARSIVELATDRERAATMGESARPFVLRRHDPARMLRLRERIYRVALDDHRRRGATGFVPTRTAVDAAAIANWFRQP